MMTGMKKPKLEIKGKVGKPLIVSKGGDEKQAPAGGR